MHFGLDNFLNRLFNRVNLGLYTLQNLFPVFHTFDAADNINGFSVFNFRLTIESLPLINFGFPE